MRILIIGGTKFTGPHIVTRLVSWGHTVTVFNRNVTPYALPEGVTRITGNRDSFTEHRVELVSVNADVVIDMCAFTVDHAKQLLDVFDNPTQRLVLASSIDVYRAYGRLTRSEPGEPDIIPLLEDDPVRERLLPWSDSYDKVGTERTLRASALERTTILRLPMIYGPGDSQHRFSEYLKEMDSGQSQILLPPALAEWRFATGYVDDIGLGVALAAKNSKAGGKTYNIADSFAFTRLDFVRAIARAANWDGQVVVSADAPSDDDFDYSQHLIVDSSAIRKDLGYNEQTPINDAFRKTVEWERSQS